MNRFCLSIDIIAYKILDEKFVGQEKEYNTKSGHGKNV